MAMNLGIGGPPKKKGVAPPPFGGGARGGPPAKAAPPFAPGGGADQRGAADIEEKEPVVPAAAAPKAPTETDGGGIPPEAVCYRSEMETCGACEYNSGGECSKLSIPVSDGDGCNLFKDRSASGEAGLPQEGMEEQPEPVAA